MAVSTKPFISPDRKTPTVMEDQPERPTCQYTCNDYRAEMMLLAQQQRLLRTDLSEEERQIILLEINRLENIVGLT